MNNVIAQTNTHECAANWANAYFKAKGFTPSFNDWRQIYDMALGYFLKLHNS